jgi:hypothetical protein
MEEQDRRKCAPRGDNGQAESEGKNDGELAVRSRLETLTELEDKFLWGFHRSPFTKRELVRTRFNYAAWLGDVGQGEV